MRKRGIRIEFDDEGGAFIPREAIDSLTTPYQARINQLKMQLAMVEAAQENEIVRNKMINSIVAEEPYYQDAYNKLSTARDWINNWVIALQEEAGVEGPINSGTALDNLRGTIVEEDFIKNFPDVDFVDAITMEDSQSHLRAALRRTAEQNDLIQKPSVTDKVFDDMDVLKMTGLSDDGTQYSDASVDKLMEELEKEDLAENAIDEQRW